MEEVNAGESWNKKRIFVTIILTLLLATGGYFFKPRVLSNQPPQVGKSIKGLTTQTSTTSTIEPESKINIQEAVKEKINSLKQEVSKLNVSEIASSSPQVQKILNDIKSLEQYPTNQAKEICKKICGL